MLNIPTLFPVTLGNDLIRVFEQMCNKHPGNTKKDYAMTESERIKLVRLIGKTYIIQVYSITSIYGAEISQCM